MTGDSHAAALRPLGLPRPVDVRADAEGTPLAVARRRGERRRVEQVDDAWRVAGEWWREAPQERTYVRLMLEDGRAITLYQDGVDGRWYEQRYGSVESGSDTRTRGVAQM